MRELKCSRWRRAPLSVLLLLCAVAGGVLGLSSCGSDESPTDVEVKTPKITSLSDTVLTPGDTLVIDGTNFATPASSNTVIFNNTLAASSPISATSVRLRTVVPANSASGAMRVVSKGVASNSVAVEIERGVGDVWVMGGSSSYTFKVPIPTGSEQYLIVPESATSSGSSFSFQVTPENTTVYPAPPLVSAPEPRGTVDLGVSFESSIRDEALDYLRTHGAGRQAVVQRAPAGPAPTTDEFFVLKCTGCSVYSPSSFDTVTADLKYEGSSAWIYEDVNSPAGGFTQEDYAALGAQWDNAIFPTDTTAFGPPTDIDNNQKTIILFTPVVNDLTPDGQAINGFIGGFTLVTDLAPNVFPSGTSNAGEIFYLMVPDPDEIYGNPFSKELVESVAPGILAHEFEHMISIGYRYLVLGGGTNPSYIQETWLEEGMAHMAEDLNGMDAQNIRRANLYLAASYAHSLLGNLELRPNVDTLQQRGAVFLFLRYLADQLGEQIFRTLVEYNATGVSSIEHVSQKNFYTSVGDFLAALYLSDRGITSDTRYEFTSFDMQNDFESLLVDDRSATGGAFAGTVRSSAGRYYRITGADTPALEVRVSTSSSSKLRVIVVRVQ